MTNEDKKRVAVRFTEEQHQQIHAFRMKQEPPMSFNAAINHLVALGLHTDEIGPQI